MYYTSEVGILQAALSRRMIFPDDYFYFQKDQLYTFDPSQLMQKGKPHYTSRELKPWPKVNSGKGEPWTAEEPVASIEGPSCDV
jgi:hypothetical protein